MVVELNNLLFACEELNDKAAFRICDDGGQEAIDDWFEAVNKGWELVNPINNLNSAKRLLPPFTTYVSWTLEDIVNIGDVNYIADKLDEELQQEPGTCEYSVTPYAVNDGNVILKVVAEHV